MVFGQRCAPVRARDFSVTRPTVPHEVGAPVVDRPWARGGEAGQVRPAKTKRLMEVRGTLRCPSCGHGNRPDRRFCTECGSRLGRTCAACGGAVESSEKFCGSCGAALTGASALAERAPATYTPPHLAEKILGSRAALEGERKQGTVLFADVQSSMELAEQLDRSEERWLGIE